MPIPQEREFQLGLQFLWQLGPWISLVESDPDPDEDGESAEAAGWDAAAVSFVQNEIVLHDPYSDARCLPNLT